MRALGYGAILGDCIHNLLPEVQVKLPVKCPPSPKVVAEQLVRGKPTHVILERDYEAFVNTLVDGFVPIKCCLVNILFYRTDQYLEPTVRSEPRSLRAPVCDWPTQRAQCTQRLTMLDARQDLVDK